jgi:hypothetical protein
LDIQLFVNLMLDRETVRVPSETSLDVVTGRVRMPGDNVLRAASDKERSQDQMNTP